MSFLEEISAYFIRGNFSEVTERDIFNIICLVLSSGILALFITIISKSLHSKVKVLTYALLKSITVLFLFSIFAYYLSWKKLGAEARCDLVSILSDNLVPGSSILSDLIFDRTILSNFKQKNINELPIVQVEGNKLNSDNTKISGKTVVVFVIEALRADIIGKKIGNETIMPFLTKLAEEGIQFQHSYSTSSETSYSLATIITGQYPLKSPLRNRNVDLSYPIKRIYDELNQYGFKSGLIINFEWSVNRRISRSPFLDFYFDPTLKFRSENFHGVGQDFHKKDPDSYNNYYLLDREGLEQNINFISSFDVSQSISVVQYFNASHYPYEQKNLKLVPFQPTNVKEGAFLQYKKSDISRNKNRYYNTLRNVDLMIQDYVDFLKKINRWKETILIVTADHGELFGEHGEFAHAGRLHEPVIKVPMVISASKQWVPIYEGRAVVSHVDIAPTILEFLGIPEYQGYQGRTMLVKKDDSRAIFDEFHSKRPIFATAQNNFFEDVLISYPFKLILDRRGIFHRLYNIQIDPEELHNLYNVNKEDSSNLIKKLNEFRDNQLSYYGLSPVIRNKYYPPKIQF